MESVYHSKIDRGFTLIEILVALAITGIVLVLAGSGLLAIVNANQRSQIETTDRLELEQALAFISDEIKMSQQLLPDISKDKYIETYKFKSASGSSQVKPILILNPPANNGLKDPIIYYLANPPSRSVWLGPKVIYRWGPTLLQNGRYSDGNGKEIGTTGANSTVEYYNEVVVDRMSDNILTGVNPSCDSSYPLSLPNGDRQGFYTCIATDRKSVKLWMHKQSTQNARSQSIEALVVTRSN
jgi:prepilin-type N-terminal cleavage/methylation domain-containing protein